MLASPRLYLVILSNLCFNMSKFCQFLCTQICWVLVIFLIIDTSQIPPRHMPLCSDKNWGIFVFIGKHSNHCQYVQINFCFTQICWVLIIVFNINTSKIPLRQWYTLSSDKNWGIFVFIGKQTITINMYKLMSIFV